MKKNILHRGLSGGFVELDLDIDNYLTIEALEDGLTASLSSNACEYCVDFDGNWKTVAADTTTESINAGQTLSFRGNLTPTSYKGIGTFTISKKCNLKGNCMSMLFGDIATYAFSLNRKNYAFYKLFYNCTNVVNVSSNFLPATTLAESCYYAMFYGCTGLTTAPALPATTLATSCYSRMFYNCGGLTTAPELPSTSISSYCYNSMFYNCTSLTTAPELPATELVRDCYGAMFAGCTSLTVAPDLPATTLASNCYNGMFRGTNVLPDCSNIDFTSNTVVASGGLRGLFEGTKVTDNDLERLLPKNNNGRYYLPATTLADSCYYGMFQYCTNLTTAPELPATTLKNGCYSYMFSNCGSLTTAPALLATTLADSCYDSMFNGCRRLKTAPDLPATTLVYSCYNSMFSCCYALNYIKMLATDISAQFCLTSWVTTVASTGTFVKNPAMTTLPAGSSGIPSGWTVVNDGEESGRGNLITFYIADSVEIRPTLVEYQAIEGMTWGEWVDSKYNTIGIYIGEYDSVLTPDGFGITSHVGVSQKSNIVIISGEEYELG